MRRFLDYLSFWKNWDEKEKATAVRIIGFATAVLAVFVLIASLSYLFNWKADKSVLSEPDMMDGSVEIANAAGKLGYKTGVLLVRNLFGLGSFALLVILVAAAARLIAGKWRWSLLKTTMLSISGAFVASLVLAFAGNIAGIPYAFDGGLGGICGAQIILWSTNLFGSVITGILVVLAIVLWLFAASHRFSEWVYSLLISETDEEPDVTAEPEGTEEPEEPEEPEVPQGPAVPEPANGNEDGDGEPEPSPQPDGDEKKGGEPVKENGDQGLTVQTDDTLDQDVKDLPPINNRLDPPEGLPDYKTPSIDFLRNYESARKTVTKEELMRNNNRIRAALSNYKIEIVDVKAVVGPTVTLYKVYPAQGITINSFKLRQEDIALALGAKGVRVVVLADCVGIEVPNDSPSIVPLRNLLGSEAFLQSKYELPVAIGYTITQQVKVFDLSNAPHLLVAGATQQGKSVGLNVIITSLLYSKHPSELKFVFIDPKMVEFSAYNGLLKHYLAVMPTAGDEEEEKKKAIVKNSKDAETILKSLVVEMDDRYQLLSEAGVQKITQYNDKYKQRKLRPDKGHRFLPYIVTVVDEYADLTMTKGASAEVRASSMSIQNSIIRLAQKGRAAGIHLVLATQRPSVDVITGVIKANFPMRIAFRVSSRVDSQTILDAPGAEKLIGRGDMLLSAGIDTERVQCALIEGEEINAITEFIESQQGYRKSYNTPYYLPEIKEEGGGGAGGDMGEMDERFEEAAKVVVSSQKGSTSDLQRKLGMGYAKAGRVMDQLEQAGIVGPQEGSKPRAVLVSSLDELQEIIDRLKQ